MSCAGNPSADDEDQAIAAAYANGFCIQLDFKLLETRMTFCQTGIVDRLNYELTFNDYTKGINASHTNTIKICLEFEKVTDPELTRQIRQQYRGWMVKFLDRVIRHRKIQN